MTVPALDWLMHPVRSRRVARLVRAADPDSAVRADACEHARRLDRRIDRTARRIAREVRRYGAVCARQRVLEHEADTLEERVHVTGHRPGRAPQRVLVRGAGGRPVTVGLAARECERHARRIDEEPGLDRFGTVTRAAGAAGAALLAVDVIALFLVFARLLNLDWADPQVVPLVGATVFSVIGAGTMAKIAVVLGDRLWAWRRAGASGVRQAPARGGLVSGLSVALAVLSLGTGIGILLRILEDAAALELGLLGPVLGIVVGTAGLVAPWLIVVQRAHDGTELTRALADLTPVVAWTSRRLHDLERAQDHAVAGRKECRGRAQRRIARLEVVVARCRRRHEEVVHRARAAGARVPDPEPAVVDGALTPVRDLAARMDREP